MASLSSSVAVTSGLALGVAVNRWLKPAFEAASPYRLDDRLASDHSYHEVDRRRAARRRCHRHRRLHGQALRRPHRTSRDPRLSRRLDPGRRHPRGHAETRRLDGRGVQAGAGRLRGRRRTPGRAQAASTSPSWSSGWGLPQRSRRAPSRSRWASPARRSRAARPTLRSNR